MKFTLSINMERTSPAVDMRDVARHTLEMAQMAEVGGFDIVWVGEHYTIEPTISPAPFQLLAHLAAHTSTVRLGTACVVAPYWHPIKLAGEAAMFDLLSGWAPRTGYRARRLSVGIPSPGRRHSAATRCGLHEGAAAGSQGPLAGRLRAQGRILVVSHGNFGAKAAAEAASANLDRGADPGAPMIGPSPMDAASIPGRSPDLSRNSNLSRPLRRRPREKPWHQTSRLL